MADSGESDRQLKVVLLAWGIPHYRVPIYRRLSRNPHLDFCVWAGDDTRAPGGAKVASARELGIGRQIRWRRLRSHRVTGRVFRDYEWQPEAIGLAWRQDIDVLISFGNKSFSNWLVRVVCRIRRIPIVEWSQGLKAPERGLKWAFRRFYMRWAKALLLYGDMARDFFVEHGFVADEVFVVRNSLDHDRQVALRERLTEEEIGQTRAQFGVRQTTDRLVFHSGRLEERKRLDLLVDAVERFKGRDRRVVLVLVGDGSEEQALRRRVESANVEDRVVFFGPCYEEETLARIFMASDLCISPGALGLLAMHSLVYGTPILTCDNRKWIHGPEVETVVEGQTGGYFRYDDVDDLVRQMDPMLYPTPCKVDMAAGCMRVIDSEYTPEYQEQVILRALNYVLPMQKRVPLPVG